MADTSETPTKLPLFKVNPDNPFDGDALDRKELCEGLANFIENSTTPYTLAVNAGWGNGKTVFLQMLEAYLKKQGFRCVFFNAWKADFYNDALPALIGEIKEQIEGIPEDFSGKAKQLGKVLVSPDTASAIATTLAKTIPGGGEAAGAIAKAVKKSFQEHDSIEHYIEYRKALEGFKESLENFALDEENSQPGNSKPLVILVDELDRCRPDFAVDVLEKTKHIFDVKSVFFVFGLNKKAMGKTIEKIYGGINSEHYLGRFFDETFNLNNQDNLLNQTVAEIGLTDHLNLDDRQQIIGYLNLFFGMFAPSLRVQQQIISSMKISLLMTPRGQQIFPILLAYFTVIKFINSDLFQKSKIGSDRKSQSSFPYEDHLEFYKSHAGFINPESELADSHEQHWGPYLSLNAIYFQHSETYKKYVSEKANASQDAYSFWKRVTSVAGQYTSPSYVPPNPGAYIDMIDSIGKLILDTETEKG